MSVKLMRMAAPREAACGCDAARRYSMPSAVSASAVSIGGAIVGWRDVFQLAASQRAAHITAEQRAQSFEFKNGF